MTPVIKTSLLVVIFILSMPFNVSHSKDIAVKMYFFYSTDCKECREIKEDYLPEILKEYSPYIEIKYLQMENPDNYRLMTNLEEKYGSVKNPPPTIFIGEKFLDGRDEILNNLKPIIEYYIKKGGCDLPKIDSRIGIIEKFKYLGVATVIGAGLVDGINPCAFSAIIIFVLYLTFIGYKRKEILAVGLLFTIAIFLAYFLIGLGLLEFVLRMKFLPVVSRIISICFGVGAIIFGFLNLYDYYIIRKGKLKNIVLQLPPAIKDRIKKLIWKKSSRKYYLLSAFVIGFLVGILEFPCTGQIYFPIILVLKEIPALKINAIFYLILYNIMFIVPLIIVFIFVFLGTTSDTLVKFLEKHAGIIKIFIALLFFTLGLILVCFTT